MIDYIKYYVVMDINFARFLSEISQVIWNTLFWKYHGYGEILFDEEPWER